MNFIASVTMIRSPHSAFQIMGQKTNCMAVEATKLLKEDDKFNEQEHFRLNRHRVHGHRFNSAELSDSMA